MKKILLIISLVIVCAALEVPEDYQWAGNEEYSATHVTKNAFSTVSADMPDNVSEKRSLLPL